MLIFLHGPDDYRREAKKRELIAEFQRKHSALGLGFFDFSEEGALASFRDFIENQSIFEPVKLGVCREIAEVSDKKFTEELKKISGDKTTTLLVSDAEKPPKGLKGLSQEFPRLAGAAWREFVRKEAANLSVKLAPEAFELLAAAYEGESWRVATELQKLSLLRREIRRSDLERLDVELAPDFWETVRGMKSPDLGKRFATLEGLFARNEPAGKIFNILAYQWQEKSARFAAYDLAVKSGRCDYDEVLVDLLIS
jgi:DNA polymerase III delta subunit